MIYAIVGKEHSLACVVSLDTLAALFGKRTISQDDALLAVRTEIDKFAQVISAKQNSNMTRSHLRRIRRLRTSLDMI